MLDTLGPHTDRPAGESRTVERLSALEAQIAMFQMQTAFGFGVTPLVAERLKTLEAEIHQEISAIRAGTSWVSDRSPSE